MNPAKYGPEFYDEIFQNKIMETLYLDNSVRHIKKLSEWLEGSVLDLACGIGQLANFANEYTGVDFSSFAIALARWNCINERATFICEDLKNFIKNPFAADTIVLSEVLEHVLDPALLADYALKNARKRIIIGLPINMPMDGHIKAVWSKEDIETLFHRKATIIEQGCPTPKGKPIHWHVLYEQHSKQ